MKCVSFKGDTILHQLKNVFFGYAFFLETTEFKAIRMLEILCVFYS